MNGLAFHVRPPTQLEVKTTLYIAYANTLAPKNTQVKIFAHRLESSQIFDLHGNISKNNDKTHMAAWCLTFCDEYA
jgi:hypothetical protein